MNADRVDKIVSKEYWHRTPKIQLFLHYQHMPFVDEIGGRITIYCYMTAKTIDPGKIHVWYINYNVFCLPFQELFSIDVNAHLFI